MGLCFSKKKKTPPGKVAAAATVADDKVAAKKTAKSAGAKAATPDKNAVKAKAAVATPAGEEKKKKLAPQAPPAPAPARTSSCTKDEVDAILIQCGRLSRSSSGTGRTPSRETGGEGSHHRRRRLGSKRSYDFDQERMAAAGGDEEGDWESRPVSRPSPHRGSPQRKRSGSRERSGGGSGSRRASRSPGRRGEGGVTSGGGERARQQQPGKMVSVPAREKLRAPSPAAASGIRCAPPRSSSPARMAVAANENACGVVPAAGPTPALSRSSSRKAEQSPYRRNPMAEIDENTLRSNNGKPHKKSAENSVAAAHQKATCRSAKEKPETAEEAPVSDTRAHSAKANVPRSVGVAAESLGQTPAACRSRRSSRDFDQSSNSYASQILEDIQNYHEQHQTAAPATPSFSLPACVSKACSIVEAVADLNSSSSDTRTYYYEPGRSADDKGSANALSGADNPTARRHAPAARDVRAAETEPQESAGSNSVSGIPLTPSWEPASVESTDRTWSAGDEVVDQAGSHGGGPSPMNRSRQGRQPSARSRAGSGNGSSRLHRGRSAHRGSGSVANSRSGVRAVSAAS